MDVVSDDWGVLGVVVLDEGVDLVAGFTWWYCVEVVLFDVDFVYFHCFDA